MLAQTFADLCPDKSLIGFEFVSVPQPDLSGYRRVKVAIDFSRQFGSAVSIWPIEGISSELPASWSRQILLPLAVRSFPSVGQDVSIDVDNFFCLRLPCEFTQDLSAGGGTNFV